MITTKRIYQQPSLSIIIATLNVDKTLEQCLKSIIQQASIDKIEILIQDGGSKDKSIDIIKKYDKSIGYWSSSRDSGVYDAWNKLLPKVTGEWILFLGADDTLYNNSVISNILTFLDKTDSAIDLVYGQVMLVSAEGEEILTLGKNWKKTRRCIYQKMCIPHQGIFHRKTLFDHYGYFSTDYKISSDYDFLRRVIRGNNAYYLNTVISSMQVGGISSDQGNTFVRLKELAQINRKNGSIIPGMLWLITYVNACFRYCLFLLFGEKSGKLILDRIRMLLGLPPFWSKT